MGDFEFVDSPGTALTVLPSMAVCSDCGGQLELTVWGDGIDSSIECRECGAEDIYR